MQTVILCDGTGVRAMPSTPEVPKPLLLVGDRLVLAHVMEIYADQGRRLAGRRVSANFRQWNTLAGRELGVALR